MSSSTQKLRPWVATTRSLFLTTRSFSCTSPSSGPDQIKSFCPGDSTTEKIVSYTSTPVLSLVIGPPEAACFDLSLRVRSGLIIVQLIPPSVVLNSTSPAKYRVLGSCGENTIGSVH